jgi:hypothetical protein
MPRSIGRSQQCSPQDARNRLGQAKFLEVGLFDVSAAELKKALRRARSLLTFAEDVLRR